MNTRTSFVKKLTTSSVNYVNMTSTALVQQINFYHEIITGYNYQKQMVKFENGVFTFAVL